MVFSAPGVVSDIQYLLFDSVNQCDANRAQLTWVEPVLVDRNAKITIYTVKRSGIILLNYPVLNPEPYSVNRSFTMDITELAAEQSIDLEVRNYKRGVVAQWVARLTRNVEVVGSSPIKGPCCFLEQATLPLLLRTCCFQEKIRACFHNQTNIN